MIILCLRLEFQKTNSLTPLMIDEVIYIADDINDAELYLRSEEAQWNIEYCEEVPNCTIREFTGFVLVGKEKDLSLEYKWNLDGTRGEI